MADGDSQTAVITAEELYVNGEKAPADLLDVAYFDTEGNPVTSDEQYGDYIARITLKEGVEAGDVRTADGDVVFFDDGTLRIRYVSDYADASADKLTSPAVYYEDGGKDEARAAVEAAAGAGASGAGASGGVILPARTKISLNGNPNYVYPEGTQSEIALFFDTLLPATAGGDVSAFEGRLAARAEEAGQEMEGWQSQYRYLDLVDKNNSNAWVSSSDGCDVFWAYPEGVDQNDEIRLLHFESLHREYRMEGEVGLDEQIQASEVTGVKIEKTEAGVWFHVDESGFSPFVLLWKDTAPVTFAFVSGTEGMELPEAVLELLPEDYYEATGMTAEAPEPERTAVDDAKAGGVWNFTGWTPDGAQTVTAAGVNFVGIWEFVADPVDEPGEPEDPGEPSDPGDPSEPSGQKTTAAKTGDVSNAKAWGSISGVCLVILLTGGSILLRRRREDNEEN